MKLKNINFQLSTGARSDIGGRPYQEDSYSIPPTFALGKEDWLAILCDGMGGHAHGATASRLAVDSFRGSYVSMRRSGKSVEMSLEGALRGSNLDVWNESIRLGCKGDMGTTIAAVVIVDGRFHAINCGDSRIYLFRNGETDLISKDHTVRQDLIDLYGADKKLDSGGGGALTSSLGLPDDELKYTLKSQKICYGDCIIICSDGIYNSIDIDLVGHNIEKSSPEIVDIIFNDYLDTQKNPGQDNATLILAKYMRETPNGLFFSMVYRKEELFLFVLLIVLLFIMILEISESSYSPKNIGLYDNIGALLSHIRVYSSPQ